MMAGEGRLCSSLPLLVSPDDLGSSDLVSWAGPNRDRLEAMLLDRGGLLFRGFELLGAEGLSRLIEAVSGRIMEYTDRAARRTELGGRIYTATDYPPAREIFLHNESAYGARWPMKLFLHCRRPAETGGRTPLADVRKVLGRIDPSSRRAFAAKEVAYVRNFGTGAFSPTWQEAFGTEDRRTLEDYCRHSGIEFEWLGENHLRTRQVRPAIVRHPRTDEPVWFNHVAALHVTTLPERTRRTMERLFAEPDLPTNTYFGDGGPISPQALEGIREAYRQETIRFDWQEGDVLLLDNMLVAHGREPFSGRRDVIVGMSEVATWEEVARGDG